ncbi:MAG: prolipoprotein diacylglyceryl transferase family protein [Myxococcota bacterium]
MTSLERLNAFLDGLPRTQFFTHFQPAPAFRSLGVGGYYLAAFVTFLTGLVAGKSPLMLAGLSAVCALSFFVWALARKRLTGREELVLLEHVWFALLCATLFLLALNEPVAGYLDAVAAGLCFFLAAGRAGCTLVGCCHGPPASVGIVYPQAMVEHGFSSALAGVRLFPTQTLELLGLLVLGGVVSAATCLATEGVGVLAFLCGYSVMRFGLEGLRFDHRPQLLGLSQSRWMALVELAVAAAAWEHAHGRLQAPRLLALWAALAVLLVVALLIRARLAPDVPRLALELREHVTRLAAEASDTPRIERTASGLSVGLSLAAEGLHVSLGSESLWLTCQLAAAAWPTLAPSAVVASKNGVLHLSLSPAVRSTTTGQLDPRALLGHVVRPFLHTPGTGDESAATEPQSHIRSAYFASRD